jgi:hypothetical protein
MTRHQYKINITNLINLDKEIGNLVENAAVHLKNKQSIMQTLTKDQIKIEELITFCDSYFGSLTELG